MFVKRFLFQLSFLLFYFCLSAQVQLTNIPTIYINTFNNVPVNSDTLWVPGVATVLSSDSSDLQFNDTLQIRGRGNSTWRLAKKPYRIKFNHKRHLLGMNDDARNWVLLANYADKTLIRNAVAYDLGAYLGMAFTPSVRFADVYLNNVYLGNYMVTDQIEAGKNRVNIDKLATTDVDDPNVTGGYLFQQDGFNTDEDIYFFTTKNVPFSVKEPDSEDIQPAQLTYLKNYLNYFETTLFSSSWADMTTGYKAYIDTTSFLNWYIASELTGNIDCFWSTYMYKQRADMRLFYGPLWDYDIAFNNDYRKKDVSTARMRDVAFNNKTWITQQAGDPWFKRSVNRRWKEILNQGVRNHMQAYIDSISNFIKASRIKNYEKWPTIGSLVYNEWYTYSTYEEYLAVLKAYVNTRIDFLTTSFAADAPVDPTSPFVLEPYYYGIVNKTAQLPMDLQDGSTAINTRVVLNTATTGKTSQQWKLVKMTDGSYQILNRYSGLAITSNGLNRTARVNTSNTADTKQHWNILPMNLGNGTYRLVNVSTGNQLENTNGSTSTGTLVNEQTYVSETTNNAWLFNKTDALVGLDEPATLVQLDVWPNPAYDQLHVEGAGFHTDGRLEVRDLRGSLVLSQPMATNETSINVQSLAEGIYLLHFTTGQTCSTLKFVVRH